MKQVTRPPLFPCADRVKVPQVGADEREIVNSSLRFSLPLDAYSSNHEKYNKDFLKAISTGLVFSEDVIKKHAAHTLPYNKEELKSVFKHHEIVKRKKKKVSGPVGRYNTRTENKHMPCHIQTVSEHRLKPLKTRPVFKPHKIDEEEEVLSVHSGNTSKKPSQSVFLTEHILEHEFDRDFESEIDIKPKESKTWDSHVLMKLSKNTARWIVSEKTQEGIQRARLQQLLEGVYGSPSGAIDTLIRDDASVSDFDDRDAASRMTGKVAWRKVRESICSKKKEEPGEPLASFYRLPAGIRRHQRMLDKETSGAINTTARDVKIWRKKPKPPPTLKDVMNPLVGDKMFDTSNQFEQEWLSGAKQVNKPSPSKILLDSGNLYEVQRQEDFPPVPEKWSASVDAKNKKNLAQKGEQRKVLQQGYKKWKTLPEYVEAEVMNVHEAGYDPEAHREPTPNTQMRYKENPSLVKLVDEWRGKWYLGNKWYDSSVEDLLRDLKDINENVRLTAIATIARAATYRPPPEHGLPVQGSSLSPFSKLKMFKNDKSLDSEGTLPDELVTAVEATLHDESHRVRITAAIALYTLNRPNEEARKLLHNLVRNGSAPERWAAAQCLAHAGVCDSYVVGELVNKLFHSEDIIKHEQCLNMMAKLSENSTIVHSMVAEQLNSTSWKQRILACKALPRLYGIINKDITNKLCNLMWNDWHKDVRMVAAHTLGKTGHGKEVHHDLRDRLMQGSERDRIDSLHKIGHLGIMTARLLPAYLQCFDDPYIAVRIAATNTAGKLELKERQVLRKLLFLTQFDPNWKVKAYAIKALGMIKELSDPIQEAIIWALRFETEPGVRAEACESLIQLGIKGPDISAVLQDKLLVEPNELVRRKLANALEWMGVSSTGDMEMVQQIKDEVRRLCTRYNIAAKITKNEEWEDKQENHRALFNSSPDGAEFERNHVIPSPSLSRPSTRMSLRTATPNIFVTSEDGFRMESPDFLLPSTPIQSAGSDFESKGRLIHPNTAKSLGSIDGSGVDATSNRLSSAHSRQGSVRSGSVCSNTSRRTPVEKLEKLIELYEGSCSVEEYEKYVRPETFEEEEDDKEGQDGVVGGEEVISRTVKSSSNLTQELIEQEEANIDPVINEDDKPPPESKQSVESIAISPSIEDDSSRVLVDDANFDVTVSPQLE